MKKLINPFKIIIQMENCTIESKSKGIPESIFVIISYLILLGIFQRISFSIKFENELIQNMVLIILPILFYMAILLIYKKSDCTKSEEKPKIKNKITLKMIGLTFLLSVGYYFVAIMLNNIILNFVDSNIVDESIKNFINNKVLMVTYVGVIGPFCEEFIFRGIVLGGLMKRYSNKTSIIVSSLLFGIMHFNILQFVIAFVLGIITGMLYIKYKSLVLCMIVHGCLNLTSVVIMCVTNTTFTAIFKSLSIMNALLFGLSGIVIGIIAFKLLEKENRRRSNCLAQFDFSATN